MNLNEGHFDELMKIMSDMGCLVESDPWTDNDLVSIVEMDRNFSIVIDPEKNVHVSFKVNCAPDLVAGFVQNLIMKFSCPDRIEIMENFYVSHVQHKILYGDEAMKTFLSDLYDDIENDITNEVNFDCLIETAEPVVMEC